MHACMNAYRHTDIHTCIHKYLLIHKKMYIQDEEIHSHREREREREGVYVCVCVRVCVCEREWEIRMNICA